MGYQIINIYNMNIININNIQTKNINYYLKNDNLLFYIKNVKRDILFNILRIK